MSDDGAAQKAFWTSESGDKWAVMADRIDAAHAEVTRLLVNRAAPGPETRVLDVGCGAGTTLRALGAAGGGHLTGIDLSPRLLDAAARAAPGAVLIEGDAQDYAFESAGYDVILSQFGVMFFSDSVAAFANLRRAAAPGGALIFATWRAKSENPWFDIPNRAVEAETGPLAGDPDAPGPTRFRDIDHVTGILDAAGWQDARGEALSLPLTPPGALDDVVTQVMAMGPAARALAGDMVKDAARARVHGAIRAAFAPYVTPDGAVRVPGAFNLFTATAPLA